MKKEIPLMIVFVTGLFMAVQFFIPHSKMEFAYEFMMDWTIIIGIFALALGIWSIVRVSSNKIKHKKENWQYAVVVLVGMFSMMSFALIGEGLKSYMWMHSFTYIIMPLQSTMFSLLAFFIASAAFRAFRAHSLLATVLLFAALIIMIRFNPFLGILSEPIGDLAAWILNVPNMAAKRAIIIGIGLGMVGTALKVILGIERTYMGSD